MFTCELLNHCLAFIFRDIYYIVRTNVLTQFLEMNDARQNKFQLFFFTVESELQKLNPNPCLLLVHIASIADLVRLRRNKTSIYPRTN